MDHALHAARRVADRLSRWRRPGGAPGRFAHEAGAVAPLMALLLPLMIFLAALSVDIGMLLSDKSQLQRAVDAAALSAAEALRVAGATQSSVTAVARQVLSANGIHQADLAEPLAVTFPLGLQGNQVKVVARHKQPSYLLRAVSPIEQFTIAAAATADINSYAEIPIKPTGLFGKIQQTNPAVFGPDAWRSRGNVYSTRCTNNGAAGACTPNPEYSTLPYGYLFRIDVPPSYANSQLVVELFDPDSYNNPANPTTPCGTTPAETGAKEDTLVELNCFGTGWHRFTRVDELRSPYNSTASTCNLSGTAPLCSDWATTTQYTLWHYNPRITNPFIDPATLSDVASGCQPPSCTSIAQASYGYDTTTDLKWVLPAGFTITLNNYERERDGGWYFYLYVQSISGSSENNFDIRTGPPGQVEESGVNDQQNHTWNSGGTAVYEKRAYPMNNAAATAFTVYLTQVPANAAGQALQIRHFDNDCSSGCTFPYYLEAPDGTLVQIGTGTLSGNDVWTTDTIQLPAKTDPQYAQIFPAGTNSAWLRANYPPTIAQDTSVWELIYVRPRLLQ